MLRIFQRLNAKMLAGANDLPKILSSRVGEASYKSPIGRDGGGTITMTGKRRDMSWT